MLLDVTGVHAKSNFSLVVEFENGEKRYFDMKPYLEENPWLRLKDVNIFLQAFVANGTVTWPGNLDIDPETLYEYSVSLEEQAVA